MTPAATSTYQTSFSSARSRSWAFRRSTLAMVYTSSVESFYLLTGMMDWMYIVASGFISRILSIILP